MVLKESTIAIIAYKITHFKNLLQVLCRKKQKNVEFQIISPLNRSIFSI